MGLIQQSKNLESRNRQATFVLKNKSRATFAHASYLEIVQGQWDYCWLSDSMDLRASRYVLVRKREIPFPAGNQTPVFHYIASHFTHCYFTHS